MTSERTLTATSFSMPTDTNFEGPVAASEDEVAGKPSRSSISRLAAGIYDFPDD